MAQLLGFGEVGLLRPPHHLLGAAALGHIGVALERARCSTFLVPLQQPAARHNDLRAVPLAMHELPVPTTVAQQDVADLLERNWERRFQKLVGHFAGCPPRASTRRDPLLLGSSR